MKLNKYIIYCSLSLILIGISGCTKQDKWLEAKNQKSLVVPETLADFQAILDDYNTIIEHNSIVGLLGTDNYFLTQNAFNTLSQVQRNLYTWDKVVWDTDRSVDWENGYKIVEYANIVIDGLSKMDNKNTSEYNFVLGQAYFLRAMAFYNLAQIFCKPFVKASASNDLGIPLRTTSDVNMLFDRATVSETYLRIISDAEKAAGLLPEQIVSINRASKVAANALLSKIHLLTGEFEKAASYADQVLKIKSGLMDFNSRLADLNTTYRFPPSGRDNPEIIFYGNGYGYSLAVPGPAAPAFVDTLLMDTYAQGDLRKSFFYITDQATGYKRFCGTYSGTGSLFSGIAVNEILLIRAECRSRLGNIPGALADLNLLLKNRISGESFTPVTSSEDILKTILLERRKELPFTSNIRWEDLRRLNQDNTTSITISRRLGDMRYDLLPNDPKFVLPIPNNEIQLSGLVQNPR
ncbi:RagB/SusD family nutrient uptake outer membrane protein [Sphingobacterium detergens]|uniref:SusD-like starch-binding protein associating with outer membrane n=1 Tax=Sphingobacterium detergens TaxID=1145106 RepID=A0A420ARW9_SPHD1|nr:RagB/SusD family nutrient uptake outer membrane protein [Sphingobacterium detergens]RKE47160.1 SusD-like starch-binding protein associating with outer membrane [Sphingobacterium detergens]